MIYLDNASTTMLAPEVLDTMMPYLTDTYGNAGTTYTAGREAKKAIDKAREQVAALINAAPDQIIFTSGGSEANNTVFSSAKSLLSSIGKTYIASTNSEHDSVLRSIESLTIHGEFSLQNVPVYKIGEYNAGAIDVEFLANLLVNNRQIGMVTAMYVNNETGAESDIKKVGELCQEHGVIFHTDCVQAACTHKIDVREIGCDFMSLSGHKFHAPKGIGALYVRDKREISPLIYGGGAQEYGLRGGTENVASIVGLGRAAEILTDELEDINKHVSVLKQRFYNKFKEEMGVYESGVHVNGNIFTRGKILNLRIDNIESETLMLLTDAQGMCISSGSACRSHTSVPSRTLLDMGLTEDEARSSIRVSFSKYNTYEEIDKGASILADGVKMLLRRCRDGI